MERWTYKGYRLFIGRGIYNVMSSSTQSCGEMQKIQKDLRLVNIGGFEWKGKYGDEARYLNKGKYVEWYSGKTPDWNDF